MLGYSGIFSEFLGLFLSIPGPGRRCLLHLRIPGGGCFIGSRVDRVGGLQSTDVRVEAK